MVETQPKILKDTFGRMVSIAQSVAEEMGEEAKNSLSLYQKMCSPTKAARKRCGIN
jgi:hypothetical protein